MLSSHALHVLNVCLQYRNDWIDTSIEYGGILADGNNQYLAEVVNAGMLEFRPRYGGDIASDTVLAFRVTSLGKVFARLNGLTVINPSN